MPLQTRDFFGNLPASPLNPTGTDSRVISDDQHREILASLSNQCPNWTGVVTATHADVNTVTGLAAAGTKPMPGVGGVTALYFYNANTPPPGWTLLAPDANIRQLVIGDAVNGGTIGGSDDPVAVNYPVSVSLTSPAVGISGNTAGTAITIAQMPTHDHAYEGRASDGGETTAVRTPSVGAVRPDPVTSTPAGGGEAHSHGAGTLAGTVTNPASTGTATATPRYASGILGVLDA